MKPVVGIVSYLPEELYDVRIPKVFNLLTQCKECLGYPIIMICQGWRQDDLDKAKECAFLKSYATPLGITGARRELQKIFIESEYDHLIMLDDDLELFGGPDSWQVYKDQLESNPDKWGIFREKLLWLLSMPKSIYKQVEWPDKDPVNGDFIEDYWLFLYLNEFFIQQRFYYDKPLIDIIGEPSRDPESTWYHGQYDKKKMSDSTFKTFQKHIESLRPSK